MKHVFARSWIACVGLSLSAAPLARADDADPSFIETLRGRLELGWSARSDVVSSLSVLSGVVSLDKEFSNGFGAGLDWGFFLAHESPMTDAAGRWGHGPGNPWFKVWREHTLGLDTQLSFALGVTFPAAWLPRDATRRGLLRDAYAFGAATRGLWNAWLWAPQQIALAGTGRLVHELNDHVRVGVEAGLAGSLSMGQFTRDLGAFYAQLAPLFELRGELLLVGLRLQAVLTDARPDPLQLSSQAYVRFERPHWQLEAAGLCNLDEPLGVFGTGLSVCSALLSLGAQP
ncbi:MAG TPA: hypothetical protein VFN67_06240 [Polyangiales bacterium]|nr:hypothetical protein [Polyangiales bacterium]